MPAQVIETCPNGLKACGVARSTGSSAYVVESDANFNTHSEGDVMQIVIDVTPDQIRTLLGILDDVPLPRKVSNPLYDAIARGVQDAHLALQRQQMQEQTPPPEPTPPDGGQPQAAEPTSPDTPSIAQSEVVPMTPRPASKKSKVHRQAK